MKWGYKHAKLGKPNQLVAKAAQVTETALFECPRRCGWVDLTLAQLQEHIAEGCDLRPFETKWDLFDQGKVL